MKAKAKCPSPKNVRQKGREDKGSVRKGNNNGGAPQTREAKDKQRKRRASFFILKFLL